MLKWTSCGLNVNLLLLLLMSTQENCCVSDVAFAPNMFTEGSGKACEFLNFRPMCQPLILSTWAKAHKPSAKLGYDTRKSCFSLFTMKSGNCEGFKEAYDQKSGGEQNLAKRSLSRLSDSIKQQREALNHIQLNRELIYENIKRKIRASSYDFGTQNLNRFFARYDVDRNGFLDISEFQQIIRQLGIRADILSSEEIGIIMKEISSEGNVSVHEFMHWLDRNGNRYPIQTGALRVDANQSQTAWTYGENSFPPFSNAKVQSQDRMATVNTRMEETALRSASIPESSSSETLSFISSVVDRPESHVAALSYFLMNDLGIPREKLTSIALKFPEVYSLDLENSLKPLLDDMLDLGIPTPKIAKMVVSFPPLLTTSREKRELVLTCLEDLGVPLDRVGKCICLHPQLLGLSVESKILPTAQFLVSEGVPFSSLRKIISTVPSVLGFSIKQNLHPKFQFLRNELHLSREKAGALVCKFPQVLCLSLANNIKPTILFLTKELGIPLEDVGKIVHQNPQLLGLNVATNLRRKVDYLVEELGVPHEQLARIVRAFPTLLSLSDETNLRPKVSFLTEEAGFAMHDIVKAPHLLAYSLEQRIKPRCALMKKAGVRMALASLLSPSDSVFYARFSAAL
jgi:hypothetical protein